MKKEKKLKLKDLQIKSFVTQNGEIEMDTIKGGTLSTCGIAITVIWGCSGNCGTAINVTCANDCDLRSIPYNECF